MPARTLNILRPMSWIQPQQAESNAGGDSETRPGKPKRRSTMGVTQLPSLQVADTTRNNFTAMAGEFVGTFLFLFFAFAGTQVANTPKPAQGSDSESDPALAIEAGLIQPPDFNALLYSSLSFGFSLMVNIWAFFRITGGLFNPAVTLALCLVGGIPVLRGIMLFIAQIAGGLAAAAIVSVLFPGDLNVVTRLGGGASITQGLFIEMFLTAQLVFVVIMLAVVKHKSTFLAPVAIGLTFFVMEIIGNYYTGGSLNPARTLGPDVLKRDFPVYHWIYWVGPLLGSLLACAFYSFLTHFQYESVNPGQDFNEWEAKMNSEMNSEQGRTSLQGHEHAMSGSRSSMTMTMNKRYSDMTLNRDFSLRETPDEHQHEGSDSTHAPSHLQPSGSVRSSRRSVTVARSGFPFPVPPPGDEQV
ncbi:aquaporin-like protein [Aspergillus undulatus]|uniref:aquaporin-like protein n=1 Tax=Aspergillus undulatus TaxID=1810928 RepID=UPI003CCD7A9E